MHFSSPMPMRKSALTCSADGGNGFQLKRTCSADVLTCSADELLEIAHAAPMRTYSADGHIGTACQHTAPMRISHAAPMGCSADGRIGTP